MKRLTGDKELQSMLDYIGVDYAKCLYMYFNARRYGLENPHMKIWLDSDDNGIHGAYLLYYDCMHFFSREDKYEFDKVIDFAESEGARTLFVPDEYAFHDSEISHEIMNVFCRDSIIPNRIKGGTLITAKPENAEAIAEFMMNDGAIRQTYRFDELCSQMKERIADGFSRVVFMLDGDAIIASFMTKAEIPGMAITGGLLVSDSKSGLGLGYYISNEVKNTLVNEGREIYSIVDVNNENSERIQISTGGRKVARVCKYHLG